MRLLRSATAPVLALAMIAGALTTAPAEARTKPASESRQLASAHQPVVSRTDFTFDAVRGPHGLAPGEAQRLAGWFDGLGLGYGDRVTMLEPGGWRNDPAAETVGAVLSRYGMLLAGEPAPVTAGAPAPGSVRVVVSRAVARVDDCPDWQGGNRPDYARHTLSNYGCAAATNLAAMIADPQDLVRGVEAGPTSDPRISAKAVTTWRDADPTGKGGLKVQSTGGAGAAK